jgi:hypothetical protein
MNQVETGRAVHFLCEHCRDFHLAAPNETM